MGVLGGGTALSGALYGLSLASTIWSALHPTKATYNFDATQNVVSEDSMIPVIYGTRKFGGVQTNAFTDSTGQTQSKDIIVSEGPISGVSGVTANCLLITEGAIFSLSNNVHSDATVYVYKTNSPTADDKRLVLYAGGTTVNINLQGSGDISTDQSNDFSCSTLKLMQHIEQLGNGWVITNNAGVDNSPQGISDIKGITSSTYHPATTVSSGGGNNGNGGSSTTTTTTVAAYYTYTYGSVACYNSPVDFQMPGLSGSSYEFHSGSATQTPPTNYATVGSYKNCAYIRSHLAISSTLQGSNPTIAAIVRGRLVYDPRTGTTAYSENPSLCLLDYIVNKRFGMGRWLTYDNLDIDSFIEVADYCDETVTYLDAYGNTVSEPRYRLNIVLAEKRKNIQNVQAILAVFAGFLVFSGDKLSLRVEKQESISYSFDPSNIKKDSVKFEQTDLESSPNRYNITYYDPAQNWVGIKVKVEDTADQHQRGVVIPKDVDLQGCIHQGQALRLGRIYKALNRLCPNIVTFSTGTSALHLQPGDIIEFTYRVLSKMPMRILQISQNKGIWTIKAQQYNLSIYDDALGSSISVGNYVQVANPFGDVVPDVTSITLTQEYYVDKDGTTVSNLNGTAVLPSYSFTRNVHVQYSTDDGGSWVNYGTTTDGNFVISNAKTLTTYLVKLIVENSVGRKSTGLTSDAIYITGKDANPSDVPLMTLTQSSSSIIVNITKVSDVDLNHYELRYGVTWEKSIVIQKFIGIQIIIDAPCNGTLTYWVKAVDNSGNYSTDATQATVNIIGLAEKNLMVTSSPALDTWTVTDMYLDRNGKYRIRSTKTLADYTYFADIFGSTATYVSDASIILPVIDLGVGVLDASCYYTAGNGSVKFHTVQKLSDYGYFSDIFGTAVTYVQPTYLKETFMAVTVDYTTIGLASVSTYYQSSVDGITWTALTPYSGSQFYGRYLRMTLYPVSNGGQVYIKGATVTIDVPDVEELHTNIAVASTGTTVALTSNFTVIDSYEAYTTNASGLQCSNMVTIAGDLRSLTVHIYDSTGTAIAGKLQKVLIRGY